MVSLNKDMMEESGKSVIANAWKAASITEALEFGVEGLSKASNRSPSILLVKAANAINQLYIRFITPVNCGSG